jgi:cell division protein FtsL
METKIYAFLFITLIIGLVGGYFVGIISQQNQAPGLDDEIAAKNEQISSLQSQVQSLNDTIDSKNQQILTLQSQVQNLNDTIDSKNQQIVALESEVDGLRVSLEVEGVVWDVAADTANITIRNTGGVNVTITSISLHETYLGAPWVPDTSPDATGWINVGESKVLLWDGSSVYDLLPATSYAIQIDYGSIYDIQHLDETP